MVSTGLDFEKPILELERRVEELKKFSSSERLDIGSEIKKLEEKLDKVKREVFENLTQWQRVQIARHPKRPYTMDYINLMTTDFMELHGDRHFADDKALICGLAMLDQEKICIIGHQKGRDTKENLMRNFGSAHPEGYRKALRVMQLVSKFNVPIVCFIDTPGAYPGIGAEERGQAEAIAYNLQEMFQIKAPIIVIVIGEGGSGGALGIGVGDRVSIMENAYYSVISPEGCAAILWKDRKKAAQAASVLKLTGDELMKLGVIDEIIKEPLGGAHRDPAQAARNVKAVIKKYLAELKALPVNKLLDQRYDKFRKMGVFTE